MGYYTKYNLEIYEISDRNLKYEIDNTYYYKEISEWSGYSEAGYDDEDMFEMETTWYDHEEHMKEYSKKYPKLVFKLYGEGEKNGDIWIKYFSNGLMQVCKAIMTFEEFDENKLV